MNRFEFMERLSKELGSYIHISFVNPDSDFSEEEYQESKEYFLNLEKRKPWNSTDDKGENK